MTETVPASREDADRELVVQAAGGDEKAFAALVRRHQSRIYNLARALTADDAEAEDLAQEAFVRAYRALGRFRRQSSFKTWLYAVALNVIRSHLSHRGRRNPVWGRSIDETPEAAGRIPDERGEDVEEAIVRRDAIDRALAALPEDLRIAVTMRDLHGMEYREIADALGIPIGTVESRIFRGRQQLKPLLEERGFK